PSVRLFEAAACETAILSDRWPGLHGLFPYRDAMLAVDSAADVVAALARVSEANRARLARRAREIVLHGHTGESRAASLEAIVGQARAQARYKGVPRENQHAGELQKQ